MWKICIDPLDRDKFTDDDDDGEWHFFTSVDTVSEREGQKSKFIKVNSTLTGGTPAESTVCYVGEKKWAFKWHHMRARVNGWVEEKLEFATSMLCIRAQPDETKDFLICSLQATKQCLEQESNRLQLWAASWWVRKSSHLQFLNRLLPLQIVSISLLQLLVLWEFISFSPSYHPSGCLDNWDNEKLHLVRENDSKKKGKGKRKGKKSSKFLVFAIAHFFHFIFLFSGRNCCRVEGRANEEKGRWFSFLHSPKWNSHTVLCAWLFMRNSAFRFCAFSFSLCPFSAPFYYCSLFFLAGKLREAVETSTIAVIFHLTTVKGFFYLHSNVC